MVELLSTDGEENLINLDLTSDFTIFVPLIPINHFKNRLFIVLIATLAKLNEHS